MIPKFDVFVNTTEMGRSNKDLTILAFDPGETVGWCCMKNGLLLSSGQIRTTEFTLAQVDELAALFQVFCPNIVVYERYMVYEWKTDEHAWNEVHTAQIIGILKYLALRARIPVVGQTAQIAKQFCTGEKLENWGFWKKGERHARDAIRHACYFSLFGKSHMQNKIL